MIKAIQESSLTNSKAALIRQIHHLLENMRLWDLRHTSKDHNKIVDCMAKMAFDTNYSLMVFKDIPSEVLTISSVVQGKGQTTNATSMTRTQATLGAVNILDHQAIKWGSSSNNVLISLKCSFKG
ncbi:hypothetical protein J1N35_002016 [Gossypium stocksii]|uniref:RNase H type-1 domain-containing protein n=1 Tax=Gossypium stocksii TaxID=47602 RepID=A0A9D4AMX5_9ROSI|nr:hypothetical protein J1N35_002016 [Gossypium stocksii]